MNRIVRSGILSLLILGIFVVTPNNAIASTSIKAQSSAGLASFFAPQFKASAAFCPFAKQLYSISGPVLTTFYPAGSSAPTSSAPDGAQICEPTTTGPKTDATLSYQVRFPVGFQWIKGGKLPGFYGGREPFSGGAHTSNGWSMRLMWRSGGAGEVYAYTAKTSGYGDEYGKGKFHFQADGKWHAVSVHVHLNSPGSSNGWVTVGYDGKLAIRQTSIDITNTATAITGLFFCTFFGGHDSSWAPSANQHLDFQNFVVS